MYKKILLTIPVIVLTLLFAGSLEQSFTEPEIISGAASKLTVAENEFLSDTIQSILDTPQTTHYEDTEAPIETDSPETISPLPDNTQNPEPDVTEDVSSTADTTGTSADAADTSEKAESAPTDTASSATETTPHSTDTHAESTKDESASTEAVEAVFFWVANGEVWHTRDSCASLSRSKNILSGTLDEAKSAGKLRACKRCD